MTQPEALWLVEMMPYLEGSERGQWIIDAAAELRRLYEAHEWQYKMAGERLRRIENLEAQRDTLLEALKEIHQATMRNGIVLAKCVGINAVAGMAIAKAEGEKNGQA